MIVHDCSCGLQEFCLNGACKFFAEFVIDRFP